MFDDGIFNATLDRLTAQIGTPEVKERLRIRREQVEKIDPQTADVFWSYEQIADPYGVCPDFPEERECVGRVYFARSPESKIWVEFGDLPELTRTALKRLMRSSD